VNNAFVWHGNHAVPIDLNDTMTNSHATALTNPTTQQTTYLRSSNNNQKLISITNFTQFFLQILPPDSSTDRFF